MAVFEYRCCECAHRFSLKRAVSEADRPAQCPQCGCRRTVRVQSPFFAPSRFPRPAQSSSVAPRI